MLPLVSSGTWTLRFLTLSWNVEEKAFGLLGEPPEGSPRPVPALSHRMGLSSYLVL